MFKVAPVFKTAIYVYKLRGYHIPEADNVPHKRLEAILVELMAVLYPIHYNFL